MAGQLRREMAANKASLDPSGDGPEVLRSGGDWCYSCHVSWSSLTDSAVVAFFTCYLLRVKSFGRMNTITGPSAARVISGSMMVSPARNSLACWLLMAVWS